MINIFNDLQNVLSNYSFDNEQIKTWKSFEVDHTKQVGDEKLFKKKFTVDLKIKVTQKTEDKLRGIYAYYDNEDCLYIGKSKDILGRLYTHFKESQGLSKNETWNNFFKKYQKPLKVYVTLVDQQDEDLGETLRIVIERLLISTIKPKFELHHKTRK